MKQCLHEHIYPSVPLQFKMMRCGHFLITGDWECTKCHKWLSLDCGDEWEGREGTKTIDGKYQCQVVDGKNKMVYTSSGERNE